MVFGLDDRESFDDVPRWVKKVKELADNDVVVMVVGNKSDLPSRDISREEGEQMSKECDSMYMEISAAQNVNIE